MDPVHVGQNRLMSAPSGERRRVLLVDDDVRLQHIVGLFLKVRDLEVTTASGGAEALRELGEQLPDLVILDLMMPDVDGFAVCRRLREMPGGAEVPVIVFTALSDDADLAAAWAAGANQVITKPFSLPGLGAAVTALLPDTSRPAS